jgi:hypothetical protein
MPDRLPPGPRFRYDRFLAGSDRAFPCPFTGAGLARRASGGGCLSLSSSSGACLWLVPEEPGLADTDVIAEQCELLMRLPAAVEAKDAEVTALRAELAASRERERRLELRVAELERRLWLDRSDSGTPSSKERIGAKERRRAGRRQQESERERRKDRRRGGSPGIWAAACRGIRTRASARRRIRRRDAAVGRGGGCGRVVRAGLGRAGDPRGAGVGASGPGVPVPRVGHDPLRPRPTRRLAECRTAGR